MMLNRSLNDQVLNRVQNLRAKRTTQCPFIHKRYNGSHRSQVTVTQNIQLVSATGNVRAVNPAAPVILKYRQ